MSLDSNLRNTHKGNTQTRNTQTRGATQTRSNTVTRTRSYTMTRTMVAEAPTTRTARTMMRAQGLWRSTQKIAKTVFQAAHSSITAAGWLALGVALFGLVAGLLWGWLEWVVAGLAAALVLLIALPFLIGSANYGVKFNVRQTRVTVGQHASLGVQVTNQASRISLPANLDVPMGDGLAEVPIPVLRPGHIMTHEISVPTNKRAVIPVGPVTFVRSDPVGVLRREAHWPVTTEVFVHPRIAAIPSTSIGMVRDLDGAPTRKLVDSDVSFHAIREYQPGDAQRHVHWKSTAKTGQLMVRQYEASMRSRLAVVLSCAKDEYLDEEEFELAVSVAASITAQAIRDGRDVSALVGAPLPEIIRSQVRAIDTLPTTTPNMYLDGTCRLNLAPSTMPLEEVCRMSTEQCTHLSLAVVVCGSTVDVRRLRRAALMFPPEAQVLGIIVDQNATPKMRQMGNVSVLTIGLLSDLASLLVRASTR